MAIERPSVRWWGSFRVHFKRIKEKIEELIDHSNFYLSTEQTGTGNEQSIAHGLGSTPVKVFAFVVGWNDSYEGPLPNSASIVDGAHTSTYVKFTATPGLIYRIAVWLK